MRKVRFKTWYWGNYCYAPKKMKLPQGFEDYNEDLHGWHNSEDFKNGRLTSFNDDLDPGHIKDFLDSTYYKNLMKKKRA
jgi:hypothetical protein